MSINWTKGRVGYDGDLLYGHIAVNQWESRASLEAELDKQIAEVREDILAEHYRLRSEDE